MVALEPKRKLSVEEFWQLCKDGKPRELVRGEVREKMPVGLWHGIIASAIDFRLRSYLKKLRRRLGKVVVETGFVIQLPDSISVRAPDVAFIREERLPHPLPQTFVEIAPDLVVEIISPNDSYSDLREKVDEWLYAGVQVIWVIDPQRRVVEVFQPGQPLQVLREGDVLSCEAILPGFRLPLTELFAEIEPKVQG